MATFWMLAGTTVFVAVLWWAQAQLATRRLSRERMFAAAPGEEPAGLPGREEDLGWLRWWLFRAGYRSPAAAEIWVLATAGFLALGGLFALAFYRSGVRPLLLRGLEEMPSGLGDVFVPMAYALPWLVLAVLGCLPLLVVRAARRKRVTRVEQDLPITLELLATLAEAGIGFDAALDRILESQPADRPLAQEFRAFQLEVLAGRPRAECLRRLGRRVNVSSLTLFISALVQATQVGSGVSDVLRRQVEELRNRRREQALTLAAALPVKLLFPLVICFLPGIFVAVLGPAFYQFFQLIDSLNRSRGRP